MPTLPSRTTDGELPHPLALTAERLRTSPQVERLRNENVEQQAKLQLLQQRSDLAKALTALSPQLEALKGFTDTNNEMASAINNLIPAIQNMPAAPAPPPKVV